MVWAGVGQGGPDGGLGLFGAVEDLEVQGGKPALDRRDGGGGEGGGEVGQFVEQGGVVAVRASSWAWTVVRRSW